MTIDDVIKDAHNNMCEARSIYYLVDSENFRNIFENASKEEREEIFVGSRYKLEKWIDKQRVKKLDLLYKVELVRLAHHLGIEYASKLSKEELIKEITNFRQNQKST
jgi:hypothetical protein